MIPLRFFAAIALAACVGVTGLVGAGEIDGFETEGEFAEQVRRVEFEPGVRCVIVAPPAASFDPALPTTVALFCTPNGNTIEQTAGLEMREGMDWHFDIQHIAAQTRLLRAADNSRNIVVAYLEADTRSWPSWRRKHEDSNKIIVEIVDSIRAAIPGDAVSVCLTGHSGGGSFSFGFLNGVEEIPAFVDRIAFLDSNYGFAAEDGHGEKFVAWLAGDPSRRLIVVAYDDRYIELNGKRVVSDTGGTYRATHRMVDAMGEALGLEAGAEVGWLRFSGPQAEFYVHKNPENKILHTVMVGEMNGFVQVMTVGTPHEGKVAPFAQPRAYTEWVEAPPELAETAPESAP